MVYINLAQTPNKTTTRRICPIFFETINRTKRAYSERKLEKTSMGMNIGDLQCSTLGTISLNEKRKKKKKKE